MLIFSVKIDIHSSLRSHYLKMRLFEWFLNTVLLESEHSVVHHAMLIAFLALAKKTLQYVRKIKVVRSQITQCKKSIKKFHFCIFPNKSSIFKRFFFIIIHKNHKIRNETFSLNLKHCGLCSNLEKRSEFFFSNDLRIAGDVQVLVHCSSVLNNEQKVVSFVRCKWSQLYL